jgi:hypothetical protein
MSKSDQSIQTAPSLLAYFREELEGAFDELDVDASEETEAYLVHLLEGFTRIEPDFAEEVGFDKPAAFYLGEAMDSPGDERIEAYRRLGDASLFNCGFFEGYISRRLVDSEYYQDVGRHAYHKLSNLLTFKRSNEMFRGIFGELAENFERVVEAFQALGSSLQDDGVDVPEAVERQFGSGTTTDATSLQAAGIDIDEVVDS